MSKMLFRSTVATLVLGVFALTATVFQNQAWATPIVTAPVSTELANSNAQESGDAATPAETSDPAVAKDAVTAPEKSTMFMLLTYLVPVLGIAGLVFTFWKSKWVAEQEVGTEKMARIAGNISDGAMSFLKAEYSILFVFVIAIAALLGWTGSNQVNSSPLIALSFGLGAICSALAGFIGMRVATKANVRTTHAARTSLGKALEVGLRRWKRDGHGRGWIRCSRAERVVPGIRGLFWIGHESGSHQSHHRADWVFFWCFVNRFIRPRRWWNLYQSR